MKSMYIFSVSFLIAAGCGTKKTAELKVADVLTENTVFLKPAQLRNTGIVVGKMESRNISSVLQLSGKIEVPPQNMVSISVPLGGYLKTTKLLPGMYVSKGQPIAIIEDQQYIQLQQDYLIANAKLSYLKNDYERQKELNQSKASSDKVFDQSLVDYKTHLVLIKSLSEKLKLAGINVKKLNESNISRSVAIYAPISGYVSKVNVNMGKYVAPTEVLFEIVNINNIHLALKVFEKDLDQLAIGQSLYAYTNNDPNKRYAANVQLIGRDLGPERNTDVHCHFTRFDKTLVPGTYMNAIIELKNKKAWVLPEEAVVRYEGNDYIFIENEPGNYDMVEVTTGTKENGFAEVLVSGPLTAKSIVLKGAYTLLMSLKNKAQD